MKTEKIVVYVDSITSTMRLGINQFEKEKAQSVSVSFKMYLNPESRQGIDDIEDTVSYSSPVKDIRTLMNEEQIDLAETFAERVASICMRDKRVYKVFVRVCKNSIIAEATGAGVEMIFVSDSQTNS